MVGGAASSHSDPKVDDCSQFSILGPMISYNSTANLWTNDSVEDFTPSVTARFSQVHNIPFGSSDGVNVIFGGGTAQSLGSAVNPPDLLDFKHIYIYDPTTKTFCNQTATGTPPTPRIRFCSVGTPGSNGSYEFFFMVERILVFQLSRCCAGVMRFSFYLCPALSSSRQTILLPARGACTHVISLVREEARWLSWEELIRFCRVIQHRARAIRGLKASIYLT
jgi:hypothetical protein